MSSKKQSKWFGGSKLVVPQTDASTALADIVELIPAQLLSEQQGRQTKCTIEAIYLHFSVRRLLTTTFDALGFLVWQGQVAETGNTPIQALDALSLAPRLYANKAIMMMAPLPVPPLLGTSDLLAFTVNDGILTDHHEYQASRNHDQANQVLSMTINSDVSAVTSVFAQWRVLTYWK